MFLECPYCQHEFIVLDSESSRQVERAVRQSGDPYADPQSEIPTAYPADFDDNPLLQPIYDDDESARTDGITTTLFGIVLISWGIPLVWAIGWVVIKHEPVFTLALPVAIAISLTGLGLGISFCSGWSHAARLRGVLALVALGYATSAGMYFLEDEVIQNVRRHFGRGELEWREFTPERNYPYRVMFPGQASKVPFSPIPGWDLAAYRFVDEKLGASDSFMTAYGELPAENRFEAEEEWFGAVRSKVAESCDCEIVAERPISQQKHSGREYVLNLPDGVTKRVVRVYRESRNNIFYLAAEGAFFSPDAKDVRVFFDSFYINPNP